MWRRERLKVPVKQPKEGRIRGNHGSSVRLQPENRNHVRSCYFVHNKTDGWMVLRTPNTLDEHSQERIAIQVKRKLNSTEVIDALTDLSVLRRLQTTIDQTMVPSSSL